MSNGRTRGGNGIVHGTDLVVALLLLAGCGFLFYVTTTFEKVSDLLAQNVPPEFFPRLVLIFIALLAAGLPFEHLLLARQSSDIDAERSERLPAMPYLTAALLMLVVVAIPYVGMLLGMVAVCLLLPRLWGERRWQIVVPFAVVFPLVVGFVFNRLLMVYLEPGMLGLGF